MNSQKLQKVQMGISNVFAHLEKNLNFSTSNFLRFEMQKLLQKRNILFCNCFTSIHYRKIVKYYFRHNYYICKSIYDEFNIYIQYRCCTVAYNQNSVVNPVNSIKSIHFSTFCTVCITFHNRFITSCTPYLVVCVSFLYQCTLDNDLHKQFCIKKLKTFPNCFSTNFKIKRYAES